jgi:D-proline reductase (dithiol) PrdB
MNQPNRFKNQLLAWLANRCPPLGRRFLAGYRPRLSVGAIPWTPLRKPLAACRLALVTTAGVHHPGQHPFDMGDPDGDPSYRVLDGATITADYRITHDYYDHRDADRDLNVVLPLARLREFVQQGGVGCLADNHYSFMGHIVGRHLPTLLEQSAPQVARLLAAEGVDIVLLTPG